MSSKLPMLLYTLAAFQVDNSLEPPSAKICQILFNND